MDRIDLTGISLKNRISKIFSGYPGKESVRMPLWLTIVTILIGITFLSLQGLIFRHGSMDMDSWSYPAGWMSLKEGHLDMARPPVYCAIVGIVWEFLTMGYGNMLLPVIQWGVYLAALHLVWIINGWFNVSKVFNTAAILSMLLIPGFWIFNNIIMAESLSLSGIILLVWLSGRYILTKKTRYLAFSGVMLILLIFTKPMFIFLIPVLAVLWTVIGWKDKRNSITAFSLLCVTLGLIAAYMAEMKREYGVASLAIASTHNKYCCLRADGVILPDEISDKTTKDKYLPMYEADPGVQNPDNRYMMEVYVFTWPEIDRLVNDVTRRHPYAEIEGIKYRFKNSMINSQHFFYLFGYDDRIDRLFKDWNGLSRNRDIGFIFPFHRYLWFPIWVSAVIWALFTAIWIYRWRKNRCFPSLAYLVSAIFFTCYVTAILGSQDLWGRIMTPVTPMIPIMAASVATIVWAYVKKSLSRGWLARRGFA